MTNQKRVMGDIRWQGRRRRLTTEEMKPRLAAGRSALIDRNGGTVAYLLEGNRVRETPVRVGATFGDIIVD